MGTTWGGSLGGSVCRVGTTGKLQVGHSTQVDLQSFWGCD